MEKIIDKTVEEENILSVEPKEDANAENTQTYPRTQVMFTMAGLLLALFFSSLDQNIVGTALPRIIGEFHGFDRYTWVTIAYTLASMVMIPIYGKLSDMIGRKVVFLFCFTIFLCGSALCGLSQSIDQLIFFRAFQGFGAGGLMSVTMAAFSDLLPPRERGKAQGLIMSFFGLSSIIGPIVGGWITDHLTWRWAFYMNLPIGIIALLVLIWQMPTLRPSAAKSRIDYLGSALLIAGTVPALLGLSWAGSLYPWLSWQIIGLLGGGTVVLVLLVFYEARLERRGGEPIISPSLFKNRAFSIATLSITIIFAGMMGSVAFLPFYAQGVLGISATNSGLLLTPLMLALVVCSIVAGQLVARTGKYKWVAIFGMAMMIVGGGLLLRLDTHSAYLDMIIALIALGIGVGTSFSVYGTIVVSVLPAEKRGQGIASMDFFQEMGAPLILGILGPIMIGAYEPAYYTALSQGVIQQAPQLVNLFNKPDILLNPASLHDLMVKFAGPSHNLLDQVLNAVKLGLTDSLHLVFLIGFFILLAGFVVVFFLPEVKIVSENETAETSE